MQLQRKHSQFITLVGLGILAFGLAFGLTYWFEQKQEEAQPTPTDKPSSSVAQSDQPQPGYHKERYGANVSLCDNVIYRDLELALTSVATACTLTLVDVPTVSSDVGQLVNLRELVVRADSVELLPANVGTLQSLEIIDVAGSENLRNFAADVSGLRQLRFLNIAGTAIRQLPTGLEKLIGLERLFVHEGQFTDAELTRARAALPNTQFRILDPELVFLQ